MSTFFGLEIGRRALQAHQNALDVTGHNISNANTKGYSRQVATITATDPYTVPGLNRPTTAGQVGTGSYVSEITRIRDGFVDSQVRTQNKTLNYWQAKQDTLDKIEVILNEPSDSGLTSVIDQFWESWEDLSKDPESLSARSVVRQRGIALAEAFNSVDQQYTELQQDIDDNILAKVNQINSSASQIADLNSQILSIEAQGDNANDLRDKRDSLLDDLSGLAEVTITENSQGQVNVNLGGRDLVNGDTVNSIKTVANAANGGLVDVIWTDTRQAVAFGSGELQGMLESRGYTDPSTGEFSGTIPNLRDQLDQMAKTLVDETNKVHRGGYDLTGNQNNNFFTPYEEGIYPASGESFAAAMKVDDAIVNSLNAIAAGNTTESGDGENALEIAQVKYKQYMDLTGGQSNLISTWQSRQSYATQADGVTTVDYDLTTNILGAGGLFQLSDFGANASFEIKQGGQTLTVSLTDGTGASALPAGVTTVDDMLSYINTQAASLGMDLTASMETISGKNYLQVKANSTGSDEAVTVSEYNFQGAATFGWGNANTTGTMDDFYRSMVGQLGGRFAGGYSHGG